MRNGNLLKSHVSEICVKRIRVNQGVGVHTKNKMQVQKIHWPHCVAPFSIRVNHGSISSLAAATHKTTVTIKKHNATLSRLFHKNPRLLGHFINIVPLTIGVFQKYHRLFHFYCCDPQTHGHNLSHLFHKNPRLLGAVPYISSFLLFVLQFVLIIYVCVDTFIKV